MAELMLDAVHAGGNAGTMADAPLPVSYPLSAAIAVPASMAAPPGKGSASESSSPPARTPTGLDTWVLRSASSPATATTGSAARSRR